MDIDTLEPGEDFVEAIERVVGTCEVLIAMIGPRWLNATDASGHQRLDNPQDYVRLEIATALDRKIRVIPVLVDGAHMPRSSDLPDDLTKLVQRNAFEIDVNRRRQDLDRLVDNLNKILTGSTQTPPILQPQMEDVKGSAGEVPRTQDRYVNLDDHVDSEYNTLPSHLAPPIRRQELVGAETIGNPPPSMEILTSKIETIEVDVIILSTGQRYSVVLPSDTLVSHAAVHLADRLGLRDKLTDWAAITYHLYSKSQNRTLDNNLTFRQNDVRDGENFSFHIELVAG